MVSEYYEVRIKEHLRSDWEDWFEDWTLLQDEDGTTLLRGAVADQSALYGLFAKMSNLNLTLISVCHLENVRQQSDEKNLSSKSQST